MKERPNEGMPLLNHHEAMRVYYRRRRVYYIRLAKMRQIQAGRRNARHRYREAEG